MKNKIGKNGSKKLRHLFLRSALITLACVAVAFGGIIIAGRSLFDAVQINADYEEYQPKQKRNTEEDKEKELAKKIKPTDITDKTIMVFGVDKEEARTDTILVAHYNSMNGRVSIVSIPRDTKVEWSDEQIEKAQELERTYQYYSKITDMSSLGGIENLRYFTIRSVEEMLDVKVDNYVVVNTKVIREIVDKLGGIEVEVPRRMQYDDDYQDLHIDLQPGLQTLNGAQAEGLLRWRHDKSGNEQYARGDLGRIETQQTFIKAFADKVLNDLSLGKIVDLITTVYGNLQTDVSFDEALSYTNYLSHISVDNMGFRTLPGDDAWIDGRSYYLADEGNLMEFVNEEFYGIGALEDEESLETIDSQASENETESISTESVEG